jgi:NAD(P)H-flavin reductase
MLDNRSDYSDITIIYGARTPLDLCYKYELTEWETRSDVDLILTVDNEYPGWNKRIGFVPTVLNEVAPLPDNTVAITCGPPIMIKFVLQNLAKLNFRDDHIVTTLEARMKCGIGICGRCNIGSKYVCVDGPVFDFDQLRHMVPDL